MGDVVRIPIRRHEAPHRPLLFSARDGAVCHIDALGSVDTVYDLREALSLHADWCDRARRLRMGGLSECANHAEGIAQELESAITEARKPPHTFSVRALTEMASFPLDPHAPLDDEHPMAVPVGDDLVRCTVGDIREAKRLVSGRGTIQ